MNAYAEDNITVAAVGDIMMGTTYPKDLLPPNDGKDIFQGINDCLKGNDIVFGNLEGPLTESVAQSKCKEDNPNCYAFKTPSRYVYHLKNAGFSALHIANNHTADFDEEGIMDTQETLRAVGLQPVGGENVAIFIRQGRRVAVVGFSYMPSSAYSYSIHNVARARNIIRELKESNDIVIVSFHGGAEGKTAIHLVDEEEIYLGENRGNVVTFSRSVIDAGADLVLGHGPHVLRAIEIYNGKLIAYSLGNFLVYERFNIDGDSGISMVLKVSLDPATGDFITGEIVPIRIIGSGLPIIDKHKKAIMAVKKRITEDITSPMIQIAESGQVRSVTIKEGSIAYKHQQD